jgi:uncharacterized membrane protein YcfT
LSREKDRVSLRHVFALVLFVAGGLITLLNVYLSFIRVPMLRRVSPNHIPRWVSGIPFVGSGALWISAMVFPSGDWGVPAALAVSLFDTGGVHWFVLAQAWHRLHGGS